MKIQDTEGFDAAILLLTKGDEIHVRTTENVTPEEFFELVVGLSVYLQEMLDTAQEQSMGVISRAMH